MGRHLSATPLASRIKMRYTVFMVVAFVLINKVFAQNNENEMKVYNGMFLEYNTLFLLTHNFKLYSDLIYYKSEKIILSVQPGAEFIYSLQGAERTFYPASPYYDINLLGAIQLFPNYGISIKPFIGINYRYKANAINGEYSSFNIKYGATLQLNISEEFKIVGKIMNIPTNHSDDVSVLLGVGITFQLF